MLTMAFGQQSGPPASHRQLSELTALLEQAGHVDFRDARGPMGFTQRQAGGKFTRDEAQAFIDQLEQAADGAAPDPEPATTPKPRPKPSSKPTPTARHSTSQTLRRIPSEKLAAELQRRGWVVMEP